MTKTTTQPAMELPALPEISDEDRQFLHYNPNTSDLVEWVQNYARTYGEACRASASSAAVGEDEWIPTNDFLGGHQCGLKWAAGLVEACSHVDGDWLYDDRNDLANAIRKGPPDMPTPPSAQQEGD